MSKLPVSSELRKKMECAASKNEKSMKRIPFISNFIEDIVGVFEALLLANEELEKRIEKLEKK